MSALALSTGDQLSRPRIQVKSPGLAQGNAGSRPRQWCGAKRNSAQGSAAGAFSQWHAGAGRGGDVAVSECLALDVAAMTRARCRRLTRKARARALGVGGGVERLSRSPSQKPRSQACASMSMRVWRIDRVATSMTGRRQWAQLRCCRPARAKQRNRFVRDWEEAAGRLGIKWQSYDLNERNTTSSHKWP